MSAQELDLFQQVGMIAMELGKNFTEPDDDWAAIAFLECMDGSVGTMPIGEMMGSGIEKDVLAQVVLPGAIHTFKARKVVLILSVWTAEGITKDEMESDDFVPISERPDRKEAVTLVEYTPEGIKRSSMAMINRSKDAPPTLDEWIDFGEGGHEGRFVEPIVDALKAVTS